MTLTSPRKTSGQMFDLQIEGKARIEGKTIVNTAIPADDTMQAFLYRHLLTSKEMKVAIKQEKWAASKMELTDRTPVKISQGKSVKIHSKIQVRKNQLKELQIKFNKPADGFTIGDVSVTPGGLEFTIKADKKLEPGFKDNLIVEVIREYMPEKKGKKKPKKSRYSVGLFPAIPIEIVK